MTKAQLVHAMSVAGYGVSVAQCSAALEALAHVSQAELKVAGGEIALVGVGKLKAYQKPERTAIYFGVERTIPAHVSIRFSASSALKG